ncbi:Hsp70 family protein [Edaphobacter aggregans]|uniref:Hsp70 family protein n=1 Tax=Edaphobacter aggregans TaxID=570835 RepID=UPI0005539F95|nr:Hsp70 family protein [Edaphobacter aggregans]
MAAKYIVGIDLGTTNSALARCAEEDGRIEVRSIAQLVNPNELAERTLLPSFIYIPGEFDFPKGGIALPWEPEPKLVIGELARKRGAESPNRLVVSAKSWLSYAGVDRTAPILPWQAPEEVPKLSPVESSSQFLRHLRTVWDNGEEEQRELALAEQDVLLTVPASFDEEARELTRRAAEQAGYPHVTLLEEPQAAFYAWIESQGDTWRHRIKVGDLVLVCDVGGGTTDFSLIMVSEENGELTLKRVAVGDHILLGGDNMDLALARVLQQRLEASGNRIDTWQLHGLWHQCRMAKEKLFDSPKTQNHPITLLGKGTKLVGGTIKTELAREDLDQVLVEGFFPEVASSELPARQRRVGFQELGLPYAADPAITKHLARFLSEQLRNSPEASVMRRGRSGLACPTHILFNGGVMKAAVLRERVVEVLNSWLREEGFDALGAEQILEAPDLEHAVARGAAYYGKARRGRGVRIRSGASRTYYIGIESSMPAVPGMEAPLKALCVVPFGMEEGTEATIPGREFGLVVGEPAEFRFLNSSVRKQDQVGSLLEDWGTDIEELSPLEVTLKMDGQQGKVVPVRLETRVTELGTLEVWCVSRDGTHRWKLELNIREKTAR